jgi:hypothetical protein
MNAEGNALQIKQACSEFEHTTGPWTRHQRQTTIPWRSILLNPGMTMYNYLMNKYS